MSDPGKYNRTNVRGSRNVFEWALRKGVKRVVTASSAAVYGDSSPLPNNERAEYGGKSPYAQTKWQMELQQRELAAAGLQSTALRFFNVFGPRQDPKSPYSGVISIFLDKASKGAPLKIFGDGKQTRDFIYVKDIAGAIIAALEPLSNGSPFEAINVCHGKEMSIAQLGETVVSELGSSSQLEFQPARAGDIVRSVCDPTKLNQLLGFKPRFTVEQGLRHTREWFKQQAGSKREL